MENKEQVPQEIIKQERSYWSIGIFFIQLALVFISFEILGRNINFDTPGNSNPISTRIFFIALLGVFLMFIFSISLFIKSKKGGKIYKLIDLIITLIIPSMILFLFSFMIFPYINL